MATESLADVLAVMRVASPQLAGFADRIELAAAPSGVRVDEMEDLLRSAHEIALRRGADTNWEGLAKSIAKIGIGPITARHYFAGGTPRETINKHLDALLAHANATLSANEVSRG